MSYVSFLNGMLNYSQLNQKVISNNLANANVPGFKASQLSLGQTFSSVLNGQSAQLALNTNSPNQISNQSSTGTIQPVLTKSPGTQIQENGNNVNVTKQMIALTKNQYTYNFEVQAINSYLMLEKTALI